MPNFDHEVELEVPPQGQIAELEGEDSTKAWREEAKGGEGPPNDRR